MAHGVALDLQGNAIVTGITDSTDFPTQAAFQTSNGGAADCYLAKVSSAGKLVWATYLGGSSADWCYSVAVDQQGNSYIAGGSQSLDFPLKNPVQVTVTPRTGWPTPIVIKVGPDGGLLNATFVGGPVAGPATGIALDQRGNIYLTGYADEMLSTKNAFQNQAPGSENVFLLGIDNAMQTVLFSTYVGPSAGAFDQQIALDRTGNIYLFGTTSSASFPVKGSLQTFTGGGGCGCDAFMTKFAPGAGSLLYSTLLGGYNTENAGAISVDNSGGAYVIGRTLSDDFPTKNAFQSTYGGEGDFFFAKISDNTAAAPSPLTPGPGILTFLYVQGGTPPAPQTVSVSGPVFTVGASAPWLSATNSASNVTVSVNPTGLAPNMYTGSVSLVAQTGPPAAIDVSLTILAPPPVLASVDPSLIPQGSNDTTITVHGSGFTSAAVVQVDGIPWVVTPVQFVDSSTLKFIVPATYFTVQYNYAIAVQNPQSALSNVLSVAVGQPAPQFTAASVVNAASYATGAVAPGEIVTVFGSNFGTQSDTTVSFNNIPAPLVYVTATQLAASVPYTVAGLQKTTMTVTSKGVSSVPVTLNLTPAVPAIFTADASGKGQGAAINQDNTINGPSNPASIGSVVALYGTGGGTLTTDALPRLALPVAATVGGVPATVYYAGIAPGLVQGAMQVNVQIPAGASAGLAVPVVITIGNRPSNTVTLAIK